MNELSVLESDVLDVIPIGRERTISNKEITQLLGVTDRAVFETINSLRSKGVPVCAIRSGKNRGYFIATNEDERAEGVRGYKAQITEMSRSIKDIESADLTGWKEIVERGVVNE